MLVINNAYSKTIRVAIIRHTLVSGGDWTKEGCWEIAPNEFANVFGGYLSNVIPHFYYCAIADDGTLWTGSHNRSTTDSAFDLCKRVVDSQPSEVGFRRLDTGDNENFILTLSAATSKTETAQYQQ